MFSYLRPRSRHGATNSPLNEITESTRTSQPVADYSNRFPPPKHSPPPPPTSSIPEAQYVSPVSTRAPMLPPIPRVASIYGTTEGIKKPEETQNGKLQGANHSRVQSIEQDRNSRILETSPKSVDSTTGVRPRGNFSRPFHGRELSGTSSDERGNQEEIWRQAAQSAQESASQFSKGKRPIVDTGILQRQSVIAPMGSGDRVLRMPFDGDKEDDLASPPSQITPPNNLNTPQPHLRQASEGSISPNATAYSRLTQARPSDSQLSLPIPRAKESMAPPVTKSVPTASTSSSTQSKPSRLTRLNPMALLTRRRSSQPTSQPESSAHRRNVLLGNTLPEDYVGIRGTRFHDFSAPRPRKVVSQQMMTSDRSPEGTSDLLHVRTKSRDESSSHGVPSPSPERTSGSPKIHTPVFKENFDDDGKDVWRYDQLDPRNKAPATFSENSSTEYTNSDYDSDSDDPTSPRDPLLLGDPTFGLFQAPDINSVPQEFSFIVPEHLAGPPAPRAPRSRSQTPNKDRSPKSHVFKPPAPAPRTPRSRSQTPSAHERSPKDPRAPRSASTPPPRESRTPSPQLHLPRHSKSNASRFSFDLAGFGSAQEKLLEDKHRQKISKDVRASKISQMSVPETDRGFDSDDSDFDFGDDLEEDFPGMNVDEDDFPMAKDIANSTLDSTAKSQKSQPSNQLYQQQNVAVNVPRDDDPPRETPKPSKSFILRSGMFSGGAAQFTDKDDFYFDDGAISDADLVATGSFDENVFDDPTHVAGQHISTALAPVPEHTSQGSSIPSTRPMSEESSNPAAWHGHQPSTDTSRASLPAVQPLEKPVSAAKRTSLLKNDVTALRDMQADLTHGNLAAYHDALAMAAQKAATEGRFNRNDLPDDVAPIPQRLQDEDLDKPLALEPGDISTYDDTETKVTFDDYEQEDDDVIAAANADALDYDADFYGDEFHFYSKGNGAVESQYGGYFVNDIKRSHSGRANGQDPSLTPITEISEWSTRNSMVSFSLDRNYGSWNATGQQPGLAQIADSLRDDEEDLKLTSLRRLRQNAFAGSASSLGSGGSGKNGSPPGTSSQMAPRPGTGHGRPSTDKPHPLRSQSTEPVDPVGSPQSAAAEPSTAMKRSFVKGHSRNSSGAESVAYVQEKDAEGSRWVLEKRRTADDGSIEVLNRQVIEGGRI